ncbi:hypothetical protein [Klenkia taihuensis]|uniref:Uncharacterized protein n=1 Tax=Klenkia taihuensis TaxID=1225127 RepID=A0A1I1PW14_9ACTN|nr:hypothetical protein [Klenkia taihuensis]GHE08423.1 hypothetical protein GCM10011381_09150 [Klenkia taihuensis]SFD14094.1 hypothetical protein SAMN05661030_2461 [Klenkia taihuensis]
MRTRLVVLAGLLALTACGQRQDAVGPPAPQLPDDGDALVLRVAVGGGFAPAGTAPTELPAVSVYRDGRVLSNGPVIAIYPAPAWPNVQVNRVDEDTLAELVQAAQDAGVAGTADLGDPQIADARTTSITLATADGTDTRDVYALTEAVGDPSLTDEQATARQDLADLVDRLLALTESEPLGRYTPTAVAAFASAYVPGDPALVRDPVAWPGPPLPGEAVTPDVGCALATGEQAAALVTAAQAADTVTPWTDGAGTWTVVFRPLLPDETGCDDVTG